MPKKPSHSPSWEQDSVLVCLFLALRQRAPHVLQALRNGANVDDWARENNLRSELVRQRARYTQAYWDKHPEKGERLVPVGKTHVVATYAEPGKKTKSEIEVEQWIALNTRADNLPNPKSESLTSWLKRARRLYREREQITPQARIVRDCDPRHRCEWFVEVQVLGTRPAVLANKLKKNGVSGSDRSQIERGTNEIAALLGLKRLRWHRGRPVRLSKAG